MMLDDAQKTLNGYEAGFVQRYHTHPRLARTGQTDGHHAWGCAALAIALHPTAPSYALLKACITHDAGERFSGDVPAPVKRDNPQLAREFEIYEKLQLRTKFKGFEYILNEVDYNFLKMCDMLECYMYVSIIDHTLLRKPAWDDLGRAILDRAETAGIKKEVAKLIIRARENQGGDPTKGIGSYRDCT